MKTILMIEDDPMIREDVVEALGYEGYRVLQAANGLLGLELAQIHLPDVILSDIRMPEMTGFDVFNVLQHDAVTAAIPVIFLTAFADESLREEGMALGVEHYLLKPFTIQELLEVIESVKQ